MKFNSTLLALLPILAVHAAPAPTPAGETAELSARGPPTTGTVIASALNCRKCAGVKGCARQKMYPKGHEVNICCKVKGIAGFAYTYTYPQPNSDKQAGSSTWLTNYETPNSSQIWILTSDNCWVQRKWMTYSEFLSFPFRAGSYRVRPQDRSNGWHLDGNLRELPLCDTQPQTPAENVPENPPPPPAAKDPKDPELTPKERPPYVPSPPQGPTGCPESPSGLGCTPPKGSPEPKKQISLR
jgi:hypothetical protein